MPFRVGFLHTTDTRRTIMKACATASGGVIFIPETLERKTIRNSNDNSDNANTGQNN